MKTMSTLQRHSLLMVASFLALPSSISAALSQEEVRHVLNHEDESYLYCDRSHSQIAEVMEEISQWDNDKNSPAWQLHEHIKRGYNIGEENAVIQALAYAEEIINNKPRNVQTIQTRKKLNTVMQAVVEGDLNVDIYSEEQLKNISDEDFRNDIIKVREKLYVFENAKFFEDVEFKDHVEFEHFVKFEGHVKFKKDVEIQGTLSVSDEIVGCDLTVGCNINMNDSLNPAIGNIVKNGTTFIHNFGAGNTFVGSNAGNFTMTGAQNSAFGLNALATNTDGSNNTGIGFVALSSNTTGTFNTAVGSTSLSANTIGSNNTATGVLALAANTIGNNNSAFGQGALFNNTTGSNNTAVGQFALINNITGEFNTAVGQIALLNNTTGTSNTAIGQNSLTANTIGSGNTALGSAALSSNTIGINNTALGFFAFPALTTGSNNIAIGTIAGATLTTGSGNIYIGVGLGAAAAAESNVTRIANIRGTVTGVADAIAVLIDSTGQLGTISSTRRVKHDIQDMADASAHIYGLRPVTFVYNGDASETKQFGLIAEEADQVFPAIVVNDENGQPFTIQYHVLPVLLLNEVQKQQVFIKALAENFGKRIADLEARL